jgi:hypothetical protein
VCKRGSLAPPYGGGGPRTVAAAIAAETLLGMPTLGLVMVTYTWTWEAESGGSKL